MKKIRALFVCVHHSARSQKAKALLRGLVGDVFEVEHLGLAPGEIASLAVNKHSAITGSLRL